MNKEIMRRNYEKTSKETLINILISSRETIQNRDKEIVRLNNIINELSKENQELKEKTKLFHKNGVFSLEYDKETLKDMVLEYQEKIDNYKKTNKRT